MTTHRYAMRARRRNIARLEAVAAAVMLGLAALALAALTLFTLPGCSRPAPLAVPRQSGVTLTGNVVEWSTTEPALGEVRYGRRPGGYDGVAYPAAAQRLDRAHLAAHRVPLLGVAIGDPAWLQAGDSHLLTMPLTGRHVLIDAGERRDAASVERCLADAQVARLDAVIGTRIHEDHIGGLVGDRGDPADGVLGGWNAGAFLDAPAHSAERGAHDELRSILERRGIPREVVGSGETDRTHPALAWDPSVRVAVLNAGGGRALGGSTESDWLNNDSIVLRLSYGDVDFIMGGDAGYNVTLVTDGASYEVRVAPSASRHYPPDAAAAAAARSIAQGATP